MKTRGAATARCTIPPCCVFHVSRPPFLLKLLSLFVFVFCRKGQLTSPVAERCRSGTPAFVPDADGCLCLNLTLVAPLISCVE